MGRLNECEPSVVGLGNCVMAYMARVPQILPPGEKGLITEMAPRPGGVTVDALVQLAHLGVSTGWLGLLGVDGTGKSLVQALQDEHVDTQYVRLQEGGSSSYCWVLTDFAGERTGYCDLGVTARITPKQVDAFFGDAIRRLDHLLLEVSQFPLCSVLSAASIARAASIPIILDFDSAPSAATGKFGTKEEVENVVRMCSAVSGSYVAMRDFTEAGEPRDIAARFLAWGVGIVAVTLGGDGCYITDGKTSELIPAFPVDVKDSTGAGDAFHGGFSFGVINELEPGRIGRIGNACGAFCCGSRENFGRASLDQILEIAGMPDLLEGSGESGK